jgi:hypothetical protein
MLRSWLSKSHSGLREIGALAALYAVYEVVRGFGSEDYDTAFENTADIVELERSLGVFGEAAVQRAAESIGWLPALLGLAYIALHFAGTTAAIIWVYRRHRAHFPLVRTTLIAATALALVGYVLYPAAPPRLTDLGFADTVSSNTGLNLSSDLLGSLYNPIAAVPSLHFGYALIVGAAIAMLARRLSVRLVGAAYPAVMLFVIVATGNHFFFDALAGGAVVVAGWLLARPLVRAPRRAAPPPCAGCPAAA